MMDTDQVEDVSVVGTRMFFFFSSWGSKDELSLGQLGGRIKAGN